MTVWIELCVYQPDQLVVGPLAPATHCLSASPRTRGEAKGKH
jgi:hypothetical protein